MATGGAAGEPVTTPSPAPRLISADDHLDLVAMPPDLWSSRLPPELREDGPRVVETADGPSWQIEGRIVGPSGRVGRGFVRKVDHAYRPGDPWARLEDMDRDGVDAQVIYGPPQGLEIRDVGLKHACMRIYNDWASAFNSVAPDRLVLLAMLPGEDPEVAAGELVRVAEQGHRGALLYFREATEPIYETGWEPFWSTANEIGIPIHVHLAGGVGIKPQMGSWRIPALISVAPMQLDEILAGLIFSGILERHEQLRVVLGESGLGWLPYLLTRMDDEHEKYAGVTEDVRLAHPPSHYFRRQVFVTYEEDVFGPLLVRDHGSRNVMWASDYPHGDTTWPESAASIQASWIAELPEQQQHDVVYGNAARLYGIGS